MVNESLWNELEESLNIIGGGRVMEKPRVAGIETVIQKQASLEDFWTKLREDFNGWIKEYKAKLDLKLRNAQSKVIELENQNVMLAREIIRLRKINQQIGELLGMGKK